MIRYHRDPDSTHPNCLEYYHLWWQEDRSVIHPSLYLYSPGLIHIFIEDEHGNTKALITTCSYHHVKRSLFISEWKLATTRREGSNHRVPYTMLVDCQTLVRHVLMIPIHPSSYSYFEIWPRELWVDKFFTC